MNYLHPNANPPFLIREFPAAWSNPWSLQLETHNDCAYSQCHISFYNWTFYAKVWSQALSYTFFFILVIWFIAGSIADGHETAQKLKEVQKKEKCEKKEKGELVEEDQEDEEEDEEKEACVAACTAASISSLSNALGWVAAAGISDAFNTSMETTETSRDAWHYFIALFCLAYALTVVMSVVPRMFFNYTARKSAIFTKKLESQCAAVVGFVCANFEYSTGMASYKAWRSLLDDRGSGAVSRTGDFNATDFETALGLVLGGVLMQVDSHTICYSSSYDIYIYIALSYLTITWSLSILTKLLSSTDVFQVWQRPGNRPKEILYDVMQHVVPSLAT